MVVEGPKVSDKVENGGDSGRAKTHTDDTKCAKVFLFTP